MMRCVNDPHRIDKTAKIDKSNDIHKKWTSIELSLIWKARNMNMNTIRHNHEKHRWDWPNQRIE